MIFRNLPIEEYRNGNLSDHISQSTLKACGRDRKFDEKASLEGTIVHRFMELGVGKEIYDRVLVEFEKEPLVISGKVEVCECEAMAKSLIADIPTCLDVNLAYSDPNADRELSMTWQMMGMDMKGRPDHISSDMSIVLDWKTTKDISKFERSIFDFHYDVQAALYLYGLAANECMDDNDIPVLMYDKKFYFCVVEKKEPYTTGCYLMSKEAIEFGMKRAYKLIDEYVQWSATGRVKNATNDTYRLVTVPKWISV